MEKVSSLDVKSLQPLRRGSVKDILTDREQDNIYFVFSNRYSVFDWGEMPDHLHNKGLALALMGKIFFEILESPQKWQDLEKTSFPFKRFYTEKLFSHPLYESLKLHGLKHHFIQFYQNKDAGVLKVKKVDVPKNTECESFYKNYPTNALVPLEVIFRFGLPVGSSFQKRMQGPDFAPFFEGYNENDTYFPIPIVDFSTKLEPTDRYLTYREAQELSQTNDEEFSNLITLTQLTSLMLYKVFKEIGLQLWDGKFEFAFAKDLQQTRHFQLVDSIGIDELRLSQNDFILSKEFLRNFYKTSSWYEFIQENKTKTSDWKKLSLEKGITPPPLQLETKQQAEEMYMAMANSLYFYLWGEYYFRETNGITEYIAKYSKKGEGR
ncbi:MAG: hypothetical protein H6620_05665 [Halobacteriovoraceae bacterium]|nr:hypothetical protein [Halobacteriovoraceae bacterium]